MNEQKRANGVKKWYKERNFWITYIVSMVFFIGVGASVDTQQNSPEPTVQHPTSNNVAEEEKPEVKNPEPIVLSGSGQKATEQFTLKEGLATFTFTHNGSENFIVLLLDSKGISGPSLVNEVGVFNGSKAERIEVTGQYLLDIKADGPWTVNIQQ